MEIKDIDLANLSCYLVILSGFYVIVLGLQEQLGALLTDTSHDMDFAVAIVLLFYISFGMVLIGIGFWGLRQKHPVIPAVVFAWLLGLQVTFLADVYRFIVNTQVVAKVGLDISLVAVSVGLALSLIPALLTGFVLTQVYNQSE